MEKKEGQRNHGTRSWEWRSNVKLSELMTFYARAILFFSSNRRVTDRNCWEDPLSVLWTCLTSWFIELCNLQPYSLSAFTSKKELYRHFLSSFTDCLKIVPLQARINCTSAGRVYQIDHLVSRCQSFPSRASITSLTKFMTKRPPQQVHSLDKSALRPSDSEVYVLC